MQHSTNSAIAPPKFNLLRQKLGVKGTATRQKILDSVVRLVNAQTGEVPSISLICRAALVSKSTFYQYFEDFTALVTELLQPVAKDIEKLAAMIAEEWQADELYDRSYAFVVAYFDHWDKYRVPLRLRSLLADAGDTAMIDSQIRSAAPILHALAAKLYRARGGGRERRDDHAIAIALMHGISSAAMIVTHNVYPVAIDKAITAMHGYPGDCQHRALAHLLTLAIRDPEIPYRKTAPT